MPVRTCISRIDSWIGASSRTVERTVVGWEPASGGAPPHHGPRAPNGEGSGGRRSTEGGRRARRAGRGRDAAVGAHTPAGQAEAHLDGAGVPAQVAAGT